MEAKKLLVERRSVRRFSDKQVEESVIKEILEVTRFAPSWANFQIARYTVITNEEILSKIVSEGYGEFTGNAKALESAAGLIVLSYVNGKSGHAPGGGDASSKGDTWSMFDAGIASHQLSLAAFDRGVGTVIQGIFEEEKVADLIKLPEGEIIAALIPYGYFDKELKMPPKMEVNDIARYI